MKNPEVDLIFVGGGLAAGLAASLLAIEQPSLKLLLLDGGRASDWDQTWSFQVLEGRSDTSRTGVFRTPLSSWLAPFISGYWDQYEVRFPELQRLIKTPYVSIRYADFMRKLQAQLGSSYRAGTWVTDLSPEEVGLADGTRLKAKCVIDCRGWMTNPKLQPEGYQKFFGLHVKTKKPHGVLHPLMMDARVPQEDGFRFLYVLPWAADELLIEDTHYSLSPDFDRASYRKKILAYARKNSWNVASVVGEEEGSLPIPCYGYETKLDSGLATLGVRGGFFHPTTGYSIYEAVMTAEWLAEQRDWSHESIAKGLTRLSQTRWKDLEFYRRLNNMLFFAAPDHQRYKILEKFYEHPEDLIARFYAGQTSGRDKLKILSGRPPVPVKQGIYHFFHKAGVSHGTN